MKKIILIAALSLSYSVWAQKVYELSEPIQPMKVTSTHLKMGGANLKGERIDVNSYYMTIAGQPVIPVMGEFHYARYPADQWEEEIMKIKAGGINVVPSYIFWNLHEPQEGQFSWDDHLDLRRFVQLCAKHGLYVIIRIGPWCHGEIRNGGFPDWLFAKPLEVRSNDPEYLKYVRRLYQEIGRQVQGLYYKDGGPIIGCQLENEMQHTAAPWAICYPKEPKDQTAASYNAGEASIGVAQQVRVATGAEMGEQHMRLLKQMAQEAGIVTPIYTATGWGNAAVIPGETLPVTAAYPYATWTEPHQSPFLLFKNMRGEPDYSPVRYRPIDYPSFSAEMGAGIQMTYDRRPYCYPSTAEAMMVRCLAGGSNGLGYYMYHGGSTPVMKGSGFFSDEPMGVPKISYDFQAPLGEFGLEKPVYRYLRLLHLFLNDFSDRLAPMEAVVPKQMELMKSENRDDLRYAARMKDGRGFLFMINAQDHDTLRHDQTGLQIQLNLRGETLHIPATGYFTLPKDQSMILPFNFDMEGALLKYATAQPLMKIKDGMADHYFFFALDGMTTEYLFDQTTVRGKYRFTPQPGMKSTFTLKTITGKSVKVTTLTRCQALNVTKVNGKMLMTEATVLPQQNGADLLFMGKEQVSYVLYPSKEGWKEQIVEVPSITPQWEVKKAGPRRMSVTISQPDASHVHEYFLKINYVADVAMAFLNDRLVHDVFYYGEPWMIGLKRYHKELFNQPMTFYFRPLRPDAPFLRDLRKQAVPDFTRGEVVDIQSVEVVPEYKIHIQL